MKKNVTLYCYITSFLIYTAILLSGVFGEHSGGYFGYGLFSFYLVIPATSLITALILHISNANAVLKWLYPFVFGAFGIIIPLLVWPSMLSDVWFLCIVPAWVGLGFGLLIWKRK
jgi:hypothetical protein